jgi:hypothetical protein
MQQMQLQPQQLVQQQPQLVQQAPQLQQQQQVQGMLLPSGPLSAGASIPQHMACKPMMAPPMAQGLMVPYWPSMMPQSMLDSTQDSLLRPPAA